MIGSIPQLLLEQKTVTAIQPPCKGGKLISTNHMMPRPCYDTPSYNLARQKEKQMQGKHSELSSGQTVNSFRRIDQSNHFSCTKSIDRYHRFRKHQQKNMDKTETSTAVSHE